MEDAQEVHADVIIDLKEKIAQFQNVKTIAMDMEAALEINATVVMIGKVLHVNLHKNQHV